MKIFIDDIRFKPEKYDLKFEHAELFLEWLDENKDVKIKLLSLDHDLNEGFMDGTDLVHELVERNPKIEKIQFHTDNYQALKNMYSYLASAQKVHRIPNIKEISHTKIQCIDGIESEITYFDARRS